MPLAIQCPKCQASFRIADERRGRRLRCSRCQESFRADAGLPGADYQGTPPDVIAVAAPRHTGEAHTNRPERRSSPFVVAVVAGIAAATVLGVFGLIGLVTWSVLHRAPETTANPPLVAALSPSPNTEEKPVAERKGPDNLSTERSNAGKAPKETPKPEPNVEAPTVPTPMPTASPKPEPPPVVEAKPEPKPEAAVMDAWKIKSLVKSDLQAFKIYAPDGKRYLIEKEDEKGISQVYIGETGKDKLTCITSTQRPGGPKPDRFKMQTHWHPSGKWIFLAVERDQYSPPAIFGNNRKMIEGQLQCGIWTNIYAVSPDGMRWHRLSDFKSGVPGTADGFTGVAFTSDGKKAVWSQIMDGNIFAYWPFGRWELVLADFEERNGVPTFTNKKDITPKGMHWNEPGNFHPDGETLLLTGSVEKDAQGMDQYLLNIRTGKLTNLTNSPKVWDEHGLFSPDGEKIIFMSSYPYRDDPGSAKVISIKTEFMMMNKDGTGLTQLTHFKEKGHPQYGEGIAACPGWSADGRSVTLSRLVFPKYEYWYLEFQGKKAE